MPAGLLRAYVERIAERDAEEMLRDYQVSLYGSGMVDGREWAKELRERAGLEAPTPTFTSPIAAAAAIGIPIKRG